jgi:hypothetical protein
MKMSEKDMQTQLDAIQKELSEAKQQMAATMAINDRRSQYQSKTRILPKLVKWKLAAVVIVILVAVGAFFTIKGTEKETIQTGSFIEQIKDLSTLATAQADVKAVIEKEDSQLFGKELSKILPNIISENLPGTKRKLLLIMPGTITAGVDLEGITESHLQVNDKDKTIKITLPAAKVIQEPTLDFEQAQVFSVEGIFRDEVNWNEAYELAEEAKGLIKEEAISKGLMERAEQNAEQTLTKFFSALGYEAVITYEN